MSPVQSVAQQSDSNTRSDPSSLGIRSAAQDFTQLVQPSTSAAHASFSARATSPPLSTSARVHTPSPDRSPLITPTSAQVESTAQNQSGHSVPSQSPQLELNQNVSASIPEHPSPVTPTPQPQHHMTTRLKDNIRKPKYFPDYVAYLSTIDKEPTTFAQAQPHLEWRQAMSTEINALALNKTWTLVPPPADKHIVGCKWVYKVKRKSDGTIDRYKARLVAKGYHQQEGIDFFDTFSPVVRPTTIRIVLSLAVHNHWPIRQLDVQNAFLHGDLQEQVYMAQPPGFIDSSFPHHVCLLSKSLYDLKQSPRAWFHKLSTTLLDIGFNASKYDPSLFVSSQHNTLTIILVYVDDILITDSNPSLISSFINTLHTKFALKDLGSLHYFLGIKCLLNPMGFTCLKPNMSLIFCIVLI